MKVCGHTLVELQIALMIGSILVVSAMALLGYQAEHVQLARMESQVTQEATRFDSTLQWALGNSERLEFNAERLTVYTRADVWVFDQNGILRNLKPQHSMLQQVTFSDFSMEGSFLKCSLTLDYDQDHQSTFQLEYFVMTGERK